LSAVSRQTREAPQRNGGSAKEVERFAWTVAEQKASREQNHASLEERVEFIEQQIGDNADGHAKQIEALAANHKKLTGILEDLHSKVKGEKGVRYEHHATISERLQYLENFVGESADKHEKYLNDIQKAHSKLKDLQNTMSDTQSTHSDHRATMEERLEFIEKQIGESADMIKNEAGAKQALAELQANHKQLSSSLDTLHGKVKNDKEERQGHHATVAERLQYLENFIGESADKHDKHIKELDSAHAKLKDIRDRPKKISKKEQNIKQPWKSDWSSLKGKSGTQQTSTKSRYRHLIRTIKRWSIFWMTYMAKLEEKRTLVMLIMLH